MSDNTNAPANNETKKTDSRKQSLYIPEALLQQVKEEAARLDRSTSWVVQRCLKLALPEIKKLQSMSDGDDEDNG